MTQHNTHDLWRTLYENDWSRFDDYSDEDEADFTARVDSSTGVAVADVPARVVAESVGDALERLHGC